MNPGTSARNSSGMLNASHSHTKREALSAESTNSTPPRCEGLLATTPTGRPSTRPSPQMSSLANSGLYSKNDSPSTNPSMKAYMSRSEEHTSELQSLMRISYAVFCLKKKNIQQQQITIYNNNM